jgi:hypothetical protein
MSDLLERALLSLGERIEYPPTPSFEIQVEQPVTRRVPRGWTIAAAVAALVLVVLAFPGPRRAIADLFGIGSVVFTVVDELPPLPAETRIPGVEVTLEDARGGVDFDVLTLEDEPDVVFLESSVPGGMVTLGYGESGDSYRLLITQLAANPEQPALEKLLAGSTVESVDVDGSPGFWIEGDPHAIVLLDRNGDIVEDSGRRAGNTLLFISDGVTVRIEGQLSLDLALKIADRL